MSDPKPQRTLPTDMKDGSEIRKLLESIKRALWIIASILLMQFGFHQPDLQGTPLAQVIIPIGFWAGLLLMLCLLVGWLARLYAKSE